MILFIVKRSLIGYELINCTLLPLPLCSMIDICLFLLLLLDYSIFPSSLLLMIDTWHRILVSFNLGCDSFLSSSSYSSTSTSASASASSPSSSSPSSSSHHQHRQQHQEHKYRMVNQSIVWYNNHYSSIIIFLIIIIHYCKNNILLLFLMFNFEFMCSSSWNCACIFFMRYRKAWVTLFLVDIYRYYIQWGIYIKVFTYWYFISHSILFDLYNN